MLRGGELQRQASRRAAERRDHARGGEGRHRGLATPLQRGKTAQLIGLQTTGSRGARIVRLRFASPDDAVSESDRGLTYELAPIPGAGHWGYLKLFAWARDNLVDQVLENQTNFSDFFVDDAN